MKKALAMLLVFVMVFLVGACASNSNAAPSTTTAENDSSTVPEDSSSPQDTEPEKTDDPGTEESFEGKTLTLMMSMSESNATDAYYAQIAAFEDKYGCTVDVEAIPGGDEGENLKRVRLATGSLSDVYMMSIGSKLSEFDPENNALDISGEPWIENIADGYRAVGTYPDGGTYITPADTSNAAGVIYNTKIFESLGLEIPETWDEFLECCEIIKDAGIIPIAAPYSKATNTQIPFLMNYFYVQQEDPDFAEKYLNQEIELSDSPAFVRGLQKLYDVAAMGYINEDALSTGMDECAVMLGEGTAAMMIIRTNILTTMENNCPDAIPDMDFFPLPDVDADSRGICYWMPMGYVINRNAKEPELAKKWCEFVTSQEGIDAYCSAVNPAGTFMVNNIAMPDTAYPALVTAQQWIEKASSPVMEYVCSIKGSNQATITSMVAMADITAEEGCEQIAEDNVVDAQQKGLWQ